MPPFLGITLQRLKKKNASGKANKKGEKFMWLLQIRFKISEDKVDEHRKRMSLDLHILPSSCGRQLAL